MSKTIKLSKDTTELTLQADLHVGMPAQDRILFRPTL